MDQVVEEEPEIGWDSQTPAWERPPSELTPGPAPEIAGNGRERHGLRGLLIAQIFGQFNDQAWKQLVILLAMAAVAGEAEKQERIAWVTMMLLIPLTVISLPAGVLADRLSKRSVLISMKVLELILMLAGAAALYHQPQGGWLSIAVLGLVGVQTAFFVPAKYGILPEILPYEQLSAGNGVLEMTSNLAMLAGIVGGGVILGQVHGHPWLGGMILAVLSAFGSGAPRRSDL
jgi:acyl-[acyl-carrier-protein]-phospholipid O-acyltransferase / long-chain-fatty-acid--[acyl-carrier-protein] ligase